MALTAKKPDQVRPTVPVQEVTAGDTVRVNINVSERTRKAWKQAALDRDMTLAQLIEAAVGAYLRT